MKHILAALFIMLALPVMAADDWTPVRENIGWCRDNPIQCRMYVSGMIEGLQAGDFLTTGVTGQNTIGCPNPDMKYGEAAAMVIRRLKAETDQEIMDAPFSIAVSLIMIREFPCGNPS